ncbi:MAG: T9SS type A sorting domain-containing protein [Lentimicrobiaceae bacterium]|nr:T9SS type A sorting domain-containing protein [Lentimicrobiaceae bacterium]
MKNFTLLKARLRNMMKLTLLLLTITGYTATAQDFWEQVDNCGGGLIFDILVDPQGRIYLARHGATSGGVCRSDDNGLTWQAKNNGFLFPTVRSITFKPDSTLFVSVDYGVYRSRDLGENWQLVYDAMQESWQYSTIEYGYDSVLLVSGGRENGILRSTDDGETWEVVLNLYNSDYWEYVTDILFGPGNVIYACSTFTNNWSNENPKVYYSTDFGKTWAVLLDPQEPAGFFTLAFNNAGKLMAGGYDAIYTYDFNTGIWNYDAYNTIVSDFLVLPDNRIFMAGDDSGAGWGGVALSEDDGATFPTVLNSGLIINCAIRLAVDKPGRILMHDFYFLNRSIDTIVTGIEKYPDAHQSFVSCYPNPFGNSVRFQSMYPSVLKAELYGMAGNYIKSFEIPPLGEYRLDTGTLPAGMYFVKLQSGNNIQTIKLIHY